MSVQFSAFMGRTRSKEFPPTDQRKFPRSYWGFCTILNNVYLLLLFQFLPVWLSYIELKLCILSHPLALSLKFSDTLLEKLSWDMQLSSKKQLDKNPCFLLVQLGRELWTHPRRPHLNVCQHYLGFPLCVSFTLSSSWQKDLRALLGRYLEIKRIIRNYMVFPKLCHGDLLCEALAVTALAV